MYIFKHKANRRCKLDIEDMIDGLKYCKFLFCMRFNLMIFIITRDEAKVSPGKKADLGWKNLDKETGTFFAEAQAPFKNHEGYCLVQQPRK